jgi:hypothetical protein
MKETVPFVSLLEQGFGALVWFQVNIGISNAHAQALVRIAPRTLSNLLLPADATISDIQYKPPVI